MTESETGRTIEAVWRLESARVIAGLVRMVRDVGLAEDLAQDALVAALTQWPESGVPKNPGAWLTAIAKRRAIDHFRRAKRLASKHTELGHALEQEAFMPNFDEALDDTIEDDMLRLMFICCHPLLSTESRVALTLRMIGGLTTAEIARSFLTSDATIGQRISRAKRTLGEAGAAFEVPDRTKRVERIGSVLEVLYLVFNEGYSATAGSDWMRPALCEEAMRLGRVLAGLAPDQAEVHGLVALMEIQASRMAARTGPSGEPVLLLDQNRARWDQLLIRRGLKALDRAESMAATNGSPGPFLVQAAIAACHAQARVADDTDWVQIASLYDVLSRIAPSPVVEVNRAVALAMAYGPQAGLDLVDQLIAVPALKSYHLLPSVRGDLLAKLDRNDEARAEFERAATLTQNERERALLLDRAARCSSAQD